MKKSLTLLKAVLLTAALLALACEGEPERLRMQKLELRQKIDKAILSIDERLEDLQEKPLEYQSGIDSTALDKLRNLRSFLDQKLSAMPEVSEEQWQPFKEEVEEKLGELETLLDRLRVLDDPLYNRYPATN